MEKISCNLGTQNKPSYIYYTHAEVEKSAHIPHHLPPNNEGVCPCIQYLRADWCVKTWIFLYFYTIFLNVDKNIFFSISEWRHIDNFRLFQYLCNNFNHIFSGIKYARKCGFIVKLRYTGSSYSEDYWGLYKYRLNY